MKKEVIFGLFGLIGLTSLSFLNTTKKKDAENIGDYLGMGMQGISYDLPNGKVLKIVDLKSTENLNMARFMNYYAVKTASGELKPNKHLPTIHFFQVGYANRQLEEEILEEMPNNTWRNNIIEYNTPVAMWVIDKYDIPDNPIIALDDELKELYNKAIEDLKSWFQENLLGEISDLHIENYGLDENRNIVFFDFDVKPTMKVVAEREIM